MNSRSLQRYLTLFVLLHSSWSFCEVGEFTVSEKFLKQFQFQSTKTDPFTKRGRVVDPDIQFTVTPRIGNASGGGKFFLDLELDGSSVSQTKRQIGRRNTVNVTVAAKVNANFSQEMTLGEKGLEMGKFSGTVNIQPQDISTSNSFGLLNGVVNRKAQQQAKTEVASELPRERQELTQEVQNEVQRGTGAAKDFIDSTLKVLAPAFADKEKIPFSSELSTQTGENGALKFTVSDLKKSTERNPKPSFENPSQLVASGLIHQDLITQIMASEIAGKELKMSQLRKILCSPRMQKLLDFCNVALGPEADKLSLVFDSVDPIQFLFENGKVTIRMNASYRTTIPKGSAKLEKLTVTEKNPIKTDPASFLAGILGRAGTHGEQSADRPQVGALFNPLVRRSVESEFKKLLAEEIEFRPVSVPTKVRTSNTGQGQEIEILEAGSLLPTEIKADQGWLATGNTFCNDTHRPFGVTFFQNNTIDEIQPNSPAELCGFKSGDRIEAFSEPDGKSNAFGTSPDNFVKFVAEKAAEQNTQKRKLLISGTDASGNKFKRIVFLCPSHLNHKEQAAKGLSQFKK
ncbi:MAG: hypothetical protein EBR01_07835 [Proteobacteria bacterium]|nr:hypothetical protein [Pseudomonadota bacterium]